MRPLGSYGLLACGAAIMAGSPLEARLVGWWRFDEGGGNVAADQSTGGANHPASLEGGAQFVAGGRFGGAVRLDGMDGLVRVTDHVDFEFEAQTSFTLSLWVRSAGPGMVLRGLLGKGVEAESRDPGYYLMLLEADDSARFDSRSTGADLPRLLLANGDGVPSLGDGGWHHLVMVRDVEAGEVRLHIDAGLVIAEALTAESGQWAMGEGDGDLVLGVLGGQFSEVDLDDVGIWKGQALTALEVAALHEGGIGGGLPSDTDLDGLEDQWETRFFGGLNQDERGDFDGDGLENGDEFSVGTDPTVPDSDGDGLGDGEEFHQHGTDPTSADSDRDGLGDGEEVRTHGTDPNDRDTDGDGLPDCAEVGVHGTSPLDPDTDGDGYPDGVEVAAGTDPIDVGSRPDLTDLDDVVINEFLASNVEGLRDEDGDTSDWIELWNPDGSAVVDLTGWFLSDDPARLDKWRIPGVELPANSFLVVFASGKDRASAGRELHTSFALEREGGYLALSRPTGGGALEVVHEYGAYARQERDVSFGLHGEQSSLPAGYFTTPTPGAANGSDAVQGFVRDTTFSVDRGFYDSPQDVVITTATPGASLIYTLDGTLPRETPLHGMRVDAPDENTPPQALITIGNTTQLRVMAVKDDFEPTNVDTHTYIFPARVLLQRAPREPFQSWGSQGPDWEMDPEVVRHRDPQSRCVVGDLLEIPSISISLPFADMWGAADGIYADANQVTEKACSIEYLNPNGDPLDPNSARGFQTDGTIQIVGGSSANGWKSNKLSMRVKFDSDLRVNPFDKPWIPFGAEATDRYDTLVLDARLNNVWSHPSLSQRVLSQYVRDQFIADLQNALGGKAPHGRHMHVYVAGLYWGMYTVHERPDDNFAAQYFGGDNDGYDCVKHTASTVVHGTGARFGQLMALADNNLSSLAAFRAVEARLDLEDFARYMLVNYWGGNTDWSHHNWYATLNRLEAGARWHFHSWDAEHVLKSPTEDRTTDRDADTPTDLHHALMANAEYRLLFADLVRKEFFHEGNLTAERALAHYMRRIEDVNEAVRAESARWGDNKVAAGVAPHTRGVEWVNELNRLRTQYFPRRTGTVLNQFRARGWYPATDAPEYSQHGGDVAAGFPLAMTSIDGGTIHYTLDGSDPREAGTGRALGTPYTGPIELQESATVSARVRSSGGEWSALTRALFVVGAVEADRDNLVISEIHYRPAAPSAEEIAAGFTDRGEFEFLELYNVGSELVDLTGLRFTEGIDFEFSPDSSILVVPPGERIVLVENRQAFEMRYGAGLPVAGEFQNGTQLGNNGEWLTLVNVALPAGDNVVASFAYGEAAPWPSAPDGWGYSLTLACAASGPEPSDPASWRSSVAPGGSPGTGDGELFAHWLTRHGVAGGEEGLDRDGDGLSPLLEFVLGGSPSAGDPTLHPRIERRLLNLNGTWEEHGVLVYRRRSAAEGVLVIAEFSTDLITWSPLERVLEHEPSGDQGVDLITVVVEQSTAELPRQFLRLRVTGK